MLNNIQIKRALLSVSDKTGLVEFATALLRWNVEIISTGGTLHTLREAGIPARAVSDVTGFPEILDGRVKTLHPKIHGGLLAVSGNESHMKQLQELEIESIDLVVVNLYPFERTMTSKSSTDEIIEQIDIGGPTMLRAAAKNYKSKTVVVHPEEYQGILAEMEQNNGMVGEATRMRLAKAVFHHTATYDKVIAGYFDSISGKPGQFPQVFDISLQKSFDLRYGENPHQQAALYGDFQSIFETLHGKELSYNNIVDIQASVEVVEEFQEPAVAIIKHLNPCGVATGNTIAEAYEKALATDRMSAFGGIVCINRKLDVETAMKIDAIFTEVIIAPHFDEEALAILKKKKDRRLICQRTFLRDLKGYNIKSVAGGVLVQTQDTILFEEQKLRVVTKRTPTEIQYASMMFAAKVAKHVKSNTIVYARPDRTIGIGAGQMSRVDSSRIAVLKAKDAGLDVQGTAVASDAFFPFADGLLEAVKAGATAVVQPGGSIRDEEVIKAADDNNLAMIFTGIRHFKH